jgi:coenzyme F420-reducing hydrogenase delta subunit
MVFRDLMDFMGVDTNRVTFSWVSAAEGARWAQLVNEVTDNVRNLGPYAEYKQLAGAGIE